MTDFLTTGEAALLLGLSRATVISYLAAGKLEGIVLPSGHRRVTRASVIALREVTA